MPSAARDSFSVNPKIYARKLFPVYKTLWHPDSFANLDSIIGLRADALSVSANPLHRNPSYLPIPNPDAALRSGDYQYVVWDAFTASRTPFFAARLQHYVDKYHGIVVHTETIHVTD